MSRKGIVVTLVVAFLLLNASGASAQMMGGRGMMGGAMGRGAMMGPGMWGARGAGSPYDGQAMSQEQMEVLGQYQNATLELERMLSVKDVDRDKVLGQQKKLSDLRARLDELALLARMETHGAQNVPPQGMGGMGTGGMGGMGVMGTDGMGMGGMGMGGMGMGMMNGMGMMPPCMMMPYGAMGQPMNTMPQAPAAPWAGQAPAHGAMNPHSPNEEMRALLLVRQQEMAELLSAKSLDRAALKAKHEEIRALQEQLGMVAP
jgi:hypothetical protein